MYLGVDLGGINIAVGLVDDDCNIIQKESVPTGRFRSCGEIIKDMAELCQRTTESAGYQMSDVQSIGIGVPGTPDVINKRVVYANNIIHFKDVYLENEMQKYFPDMPVYVENDANAAAYGEIVGEAAKKCSSALVVTLGTGVGGGMIIDNKIYAGFNHAGGEVGHMVIERNGVPCTCGRKGCFEMYASATALIRETAEVIKQYPESIIHELIDYNVENISGRTAFLAAEQGDEAGKIIVERYIECLGIGITNLMNIFQPEVLVIGGGISKEGETLLTPLRAYVKKHIYTRDTSEPQMITAKLGNDAGIIGAAMIWRQIDGDYISKECEFYDAGMV